jgi:Ca2+-binding EF-hand superfamily protein
MTRLMTLTAIAALTLGGTAAYAAGQGKAMMKGNDAQMIQFGDIDADGDGRITRAEMTAHREAMMKDRFDAADANDDGMVDAEEMQAQMTEYMQARMQNRIDRMIAARDADGDGALSMDEMGPLSPAARMMMRTDADGDGALTRDEFKAGAQARGQQMGAHGRGMGRHGMGHQSMGHQGMGMQDCMGRGMGMAN